MPIPVLRCRFALVTLGLGLFAALPALANPPKEAEDDGVSSASQPQAGSFVPPGPGPLAATAPAPGPQPVELEPPALASGTPAPAAAPAALDAVRIENPRECIWCLRGVEEGDNTYMRFVPEPGDGKAAAGEAWAGPGCLIKRFPPGSPGEDYGTEAGSSYLYLAPRSTTWFRFPPNPGQRPMHMRAVLHDQDDNAECTLDFFQTGSAPGRPSRTVITVSPHFGEGRQAAKVVRQDETGTVVTLSRDEYLPTDPFPRSSLNDPPRRVEAADGKAGSCSSSSAALPGVEEGVEIPPWLAACLAADGETLLAPLPGTGPDLGRAGAGPRSSGRRQAGAGAGSRPEVKADSLFGTPSASSAAGIPLPRKGLLARPPGPGSARPAAGSPAAAGAAASPAGAGAPAPPRATGHGTKRKATQSPEGAPAAAKAPRT